MSVSCPRCDSDDTLLLHTGVEAGAALWHVFHCQHCAFTWRDTEPAITIDPHKRPAWARLKGVDFSQLRQILPIDTTTGSEG